MAPSSTCFFAMLATQLPFAGGEDTDEEQAALRAKVMGGEWDEAPRLAERSEPALDLVSALLRLAPAERATLDDVCEHGWIGSADAIPWRGFDEFPRGKP